MQWDVEPVAAQMSQIASNLTARIDALDPESDSPVFSDFSFAIATGDWELTNGLYKARVNNTVLLTANAGIQVFYDQTLRTSVAGDIFTEKYTGYVDFYTTTMPTGSVTGVVRVIDSIGGIVPVNRGGTGASTPKQARENLNAPIRDIPIDFSTVSSLPQTIYDADITANMVAFDAVFGNPAAVPGGIDVTFAAGSVTISGTMTSGQSTTIKFWAHEQRTAVEGAETPTEQQRITDFVQVQAQTLTTDQQTQARTNIAAASASDVTSLNDKLTKTSVSVTWESGKSPTFGTTLAIAGIVLFSVYFSSITFTTSWVTIGQLQSGYYPTEGLYLMSGLGAGKYMYISNEGVIMIKADNAASNTVASFNIAYAV